MPIARTKTFTGCWTCRARKIKCDVERPTCNRCKKANLTCEGYSIKLRWSNGNDGRVDKKEEDDYFQRRRVGKFLCVVDQVMIRWANGV